MSMDATERYLAEVDAALAAQEVEDRAEIVAGLREHIEEATSAEGGLTPAEVMRELGDPQAIAASAGGRSQPITAGGARSKPWFSILALVLVFGGAVLAGLLLPIILVLIGWVLMWLSKVWTAREKLWGTLLVPAPGLVLWIVLGFANVGQECVSITSGNDEQTTCTSVSGPDGVVATILLVAIALLGAIVTIRLARRALVHR